MYEVKVPVLSWYFKVLHLKKISKIILILKPLDGKKHISYWKLIDNIINKVLCANRNRYYKVINLKKSIIFNN